MTFRQMFVAAAILFAVYFPVAFYLKSTYVPQPDSPKWNYISGPFVRVSGYAWQAVMPKEFDATADSDDDPDRSALQLYENEKPIGPPHSVHEDIVKWGHGRYSHWKGVGIIFSATDNSDPNWNWKRYSIKPASTEASPP